MIVPAIEACIGMRKAQREQNEKGALYPDKKAFYVLPARGRWFRFLVWVTAPRDLYRQIEWHDDGAVFFARKSQ